MSNIILYFLFLLLADVYLFYMYVYNIVQLVVGFMRLCAIATAMKAVMWYTCSLSLEDSGVSVHNASV